MAAKLPVLGAVALLVVFSGCKTIRSVRLEPGRPLALTPAEAKDLHAEGTALYAEQPRSLVGVTRAAMLLELAARSLRDDYEAQWRAAQALSYLSEHETRHAFRRQAAERGIVLARQARDRASDRVEGHYWYAINVGLLADVDRSYGLDAVSEMQAALNQAIEIDERYDLAGPLRVLGILHLRTPAPPASIGSPRKGLRLLQRAVDHFPDYPENYLYLGEALRDNRRTDQARDALQKVIDAAPWPDRQSESSRWRAEAEKLLGKLADR